MWKSIIAYLSRRWAVLPKRIASVRAVKCRERTIAQVARAIIAKQKASIATAISHRLLVPEVAKTQVIANVRTIASLMTMV
jgi:DNA-directed RNA polymerase specialized sigma54-like protein